MGKMGFRIPSQKRVMHTRPGPGGVQNLLNNLSAFVGVISNGSARLKVRKVVIKKRGLHRSDMPIDPLDRGFERQPNHILMF